jgi:hypothetical protein
MSTDTVAATGKVSIKPIHPALAEEGGKITEVLTCEDREKYFRVKKTDFASELLYHQSMLLYYDDQIAAVQGRKKEHEQEIIEIQTFGDAASRAMIKEVRKAQEKQVELEKKLLEMNPNVDLEAVGLRKPTKAATTKDTKAVKKNGK